MVSKICAELSKIVTRQKRDSQPHATVLPVGGARVKRRRFLWMELARGSQSSATQAAALAFRRGSFKLPCVNEDVTEDDAPLLTRTQVAGCVILAVVVTIA